MSSLHILTDALIENSFLFLIKRLDDNKQINLKLPFDGVCMDNNLFTSAENLKRCVPTFKLAI